MHAQADENVVALTRQLLQNTEVATGTGTAVLHIKLQLFLVLACGMIMFSANWCHMSNAEWLVH